VEGSAALAGFLPSSETILPAQDCDGSNVVDRISPAAAKQQRCAHCEIARGYGPFVDAGGTLPAEHHCRADINRGCVLRGRDVDMADRIADLLLEACLRLPGDVCLCASFIIPQA